MTSNFLSLSEFIVDKPPADYFVYYEEWDGQVVEISNKPKPSKHSYLKTNDDNARKIMLGELDPRRFVVSESKDGFILMAKSKKLTIKKEEDQLSMIPKYHNKNCDVNVILYTNDWKMEVNFNQDTVYRMTGNRHVKKQSSQSQYSKIKFYLISKKNPSYLMSTYEIDPIDLMNDGFRIFDMSHLRTICSLSDIQILTRRIFKSYSIRTKEYFVGAEYSSNKSHKRYHAKIYEPGQIQVPTFVISNTTNGWVMRSNFSDPQEHKIFGDLTFYITKPDPNILLSTIKIPFEKIGWKQEINLNLTDNINQCRILVSDNIRNITFAQEEITI